MKKTMVAVFIIILIVGITSLTACDVKYESVTNKVENYTYSHIVLKENETFTVDIKNIFRYSGIDISSYKIECSSPDIVKINRNKLTAKATGSAELVANLYSRANKTQYVTSFAKVYIIIEKDFEKISTVEDLIRLQSKRSGNYILANDIDLSGVNWEPIGNYPSGNEFSGMFVNLKDYKINNLTIKSTENIYKGPYGGCSLGLFGSTKRSFFYGLNLENVSLNGSDFNPEYSGSHTGGIVGSSLDDTFYNCKVQGSLSSTSMTGGIVGGSSWSRFIGCEFNGFIEDSIKASSQNGSGGISGFIGGGRIVDCKVNAQISGSKSAGLLAGWCETNGGLFENNTCSGEIVSGNGYSLEYGVYIKNFSMSNRN